jgi:transcriptional regulator with XRE-family HTH domain
MIDAPPARRLLLGAALRRYRKELGYVLEDAARVLDCDRSKISRIETGQRGIRPRELRELLTEYGVSEHEQGALTAIARARRRDRLWQPYAETLPEPYLDYLVLEQAASDILIYDPQRVPDLLQTPEYAQAATTGRAGTGQHSPAGLTAARQQALLERRPGIIALISGAVLRQLNGRPDVIRDQLMALAKPHTLVAVQLLPSETALPPGGPATILRFASLPALGAVYLPGLSGGICLADQHEVASYLAAFEQLQAAALSPVASAQLITEMTEREVS